MLTQLIQPLSSSGGADTITQLNQVLQTQVGGGGDDGNLTLSEILASGKLTKGAIYSFLSLLSGQKLTENTTVKLNVSTQFNDLIDLIGRDQVQLQNNVSDQLANFGIPTFYNVPLINLTVQNLTNSSLFPQLLSVGNVTLNIGNATFSIQNITNQTELAQILNLAQNLTISGQNFTLNTANLTNLTADQALVILQNQSIQTGNFSLNTGPLINQTSQTLLAQLRNVSFTGGNIALNLSQLAAGNQTVVNVRPRDALLQLIGLANSLIGGGNSNNSPEIDIPIDLIVSFIAENNAVPSEVNLTYTVVEGIDLPLGKFANTLGNVAIVDCHSIGIKLKSIIQQVVQQIQSINSVTRAIMNQLLPDINLILEQNIGEIDLCKYALSIEGILTKPAQYYMIGNNNQMKEALIGKGMEIVERIGFNTNSTMTAPLVNSVEQLGFLRVFLTSSMSTVVFFLAILSIQLIYSLMVSDVDEKTYQYGMLRALGFKQKGLISLISLQSFFFSIPGLSGGLIVASFLNFAVRFFIFTYSRNSTDYNLSDGAILLGTGMGLFLPLLANILPIQKALSKNLRSSLDLYHRAANELTVSMKRLENMGMSVPQLMLAILLVFLGILTYYFAPLSFLYRNYTLFFMILNLILIMMILGLSFLSLLTLPYLQRLFLRVFLCLRPKDKVLNSIIQKNLSTHEERNTKTAMMFVIALSFLIFAGCIFELLGLLISSQLESAMGGVDLYATSQVSLVNFLDEGSMTAFIEEQKAIDGAIEAYTFASTDLTDLLQMIASSTNTRQRIIFGTGCGYNQVRVRFYSINENYLDTVDTQKYFMANEIQGGREKTDAARMLYENKTQTGGFKLFDERLVYSQDYANNSALSLEAPEKLNLIIPEGFRDELSVDTTTSARICLNYQLEATESCPYPYEADIKAMLTKIPGFFFMSYRQITYSGSVLVSHSDYKRVLENLMADQTDDIMANNFRETTKGYNFTDNIPKEFLFVRLKPGLPLYRREFISNGIRAYLRDDLSFVFDIEDLKKSLESSLSLFSLFSLIVGVIAIILAFFLLLTSTNANIRDNAWELGVLKAIGVNKEQCQSMLLYEAFATVGSALILGITIGLVIAFTLTAQFYLFIELPIVLSFPTTLFVVMIILSLLTTLLAVLLPVHFDLNTRVIASILKAAA